MRDRADLKSIHKFSSRNRVLLEESDFAGCFYCEARFHPSEIQEWIPEPSRTNPRELDEDITALCPRCSIDSVLPSAAPITFDETLLREMRAHWFDQ